MVSRIRLYFRAMRVKDAISFLWIPMGTIIASCLFFEIPMSFAYAMMILFTMGVFSLYGFCINNFFDHRIDNARPKGENRNVFAKGKVSMLEMAALNLLLFGVTLVLTYFWFTAQLALMAMLLLNATLYSRLFKRLPILDLISHFIIVFSFFVFPAAIMGLHESVVLLASGAFLAISNLITLEWNQLLGLEWDKKAGIKTTAVVFGRRWARAISYGSALSLFVLIGAAASMLNSPVPLLGMPLPCLILLRMRNKGFLGSHYENALVGYTALGVLAPSLMLLFI